jgi:hypothetical protein
VEPSYGTLDLSPNFEYRKLVYLERNSCQLDGGEKKRVEVSSVGARCSRLKVTAQYRYRKERIFGDF